VAGAGDVGGAEEDHRVTPDPPHRSRPISRRGFGIAGVVLVATAAVAGVRGLVHNEGGARAVFKVFKPKPAQVLDLSMWKIGLPTAVEVKNPQLQSYSDATFQTVQAVQFTAHCGDQPQPGSNYARSELREMNADGSAAAWSSTTGTHIMTITQRITHLPVVKPELICGQIHNSSYLILVRLSGHTLSVNYVDAVAGTLDSNYGLGTEFELKLVVAAGYVDVFYNGVRKIHLAMAATGCYFKAGCYVQSSTATGDAASAYGQVEISQLLISHTN
jgi:Alginate lyase